MLVRRVCAEDKKWHAATDHLKGTDVYGVSQGTAKPLFLRLFACKLLPLLAMQLFAGPQGPASFSAYFASLPFNYFYVSTGDHTIWMLFSKGSLEATEGHSSAVALKLLASHTQQHPYEVQLNPPHHPLSLLCDALPCHLLFVCCKCRC